MNKVLVIEDQPQMRTNLALMLQLNGYEVATAENGRAGLESVHAAIPDLILCDVMMPELDGHGVLEALRQDEETAGIPFIFLTAKGDKRDQRTGMNLGANDYLPKPVTEADLIDSVRVRLEGVSALKRRLRGMERERRLSDALLLNILPASVADRLKGGERVIADSTEAATILFADLVGFTELSSRLSANEVVRMLNSLFSAFDECAHQCGVEKIKTIGDAYMAVAGLPDPQPDHAERALRLALCLLESTQDFNETNGTELDLRIGLNTGPVVAGVIGKRKFSYDLWGDAVNVASRMESHGLPGRIQLTESTCRLLEHAHSFESRGAIEIKGKGTMNTHLYSGGYPNTSNKKSIGRSHTLALETA